MLQANGQRDPAARVRRWARTVDAVTIGLVILTAVAAFHPFRFEVFTVLISVRRWSRVALLACVIGTIRHWLVPRPSVFESIRESMRRLPTRRIADVLRANAALLVALGIPGLVMAAILVRGYDGVTYLRGDCPYYYWTALALLNRQGFDISGELPEGWQHHLNQIALSITNTPVPKHPVVLPIVSLPFIAAFGKPGALVFNVVQILLLLLVLYRMAALVAGPVAASAAVVLTFLGSLFPHYVWNYSPDVCATLLLMAGTLLVATGSRTFHFLLGGFLLGAAVVAKFPLAIFLPGSFFIRDQPFWKMSLATIAGMAVPLALFALMNLQLFGSPFITSYDRIATLKHGNVPAVYSQRKSFDLPITKGIRGQLLDREHGLLTTSPVTVLAVLGVPLLLRREPRLGAHLVLSSLALFLLFSTYDQWTASHYGNRFLMPAVAAFTVPLAIACDRISAGRVLNT